MVWIALLNTMFFVRTDYASLLQRNTSQIQGNTAKNNIFHFFNQQKMLLKYLNKHLNICQELNEKFDTVFKHEYINKGEILFRPESFSQKIIFIEKGLIRTYY